MTTTPERVHTLKQPLHLISMQAEIMLYKPEISDEEKRRLLFRIVEMASSVSGLIDDYCSSEDKTACPHCGGG